MKEITVSKKAGDLITKIINDTISYANGANYSLEERENSLNKLYKYIAKLEGGKERFDPNSKGQMVETVGGKWRKA